MKSIRVFLVAVILSVVVLFNFIAALRGYQSSMKEAEYLFDQQLLAMAKLIGNFSPSKNGTKEIEYPESEIAFQIWDGSKLQVASPNAPLIPLSDFKPQFDFTNFGGYRWRTIAHYNYANGYWVIVAERTDLRYTIAENLIIQSILPMLIGLPMLAFFIWGIVSHGLKPLSVLAKELANRRPEDLSLLSVRDAKQELVQIVRSSNGLLQRLETSLVRERRFASDAAHELRTPIAALKVQLYNASQSIPNSEHIDKLNSTASHLEHIVEQILAMYRSSPDRYNANFTDIDLSLLVQQVIADEYMVFEKKQQTIELEANHSLVSGDQFALTTMLQNLLRNANKYTPRGGHIRVSLESQQHRIRLRVEDSGCGIAKSKRTQVFDRFYRINGDRNDSIESGCGLGLAIVNLIVNIHNATITIEDSSYPTGTAVDVFFPVAV